MESESSKSQLVARGTDGSSLWRDRKDETSSVYLRFYSDGTVIHTFTSGSPEQIQKWFKKPYEYSGSYSIRGASLTFSMNTINGLIDFDGVVEGNALDLTQFSHKFKNTYNNRYHLVDEPPISPPRAASPLPDLTGILSDFDLFELLGTRPIALNVASMFEVTRRSVGGTIRLIDLYFENGIVLLNVRIAMDRMVSIPSAYKSVPIKTVGVADLERHRESPPMRADRHNKT